MPTTSDVVNLHLKCFSEKNLDGVLADYEPDAVLFIPGGALRGRRRTKVYSVVEGADIVMKSSGKWQRTIVSEWPTIGKLAQ